MGVPRRCVVAVVGVVLLITWGSQAGGTTRPAGSDAGATPVTSTRTATSETTTVRFFEPFAPSGIARGIRVTGLGQGYCWESSAVVPDPHAWRCFQGNVIRDPCFSSPYVADPKTVLCWTEWSGVLALGLTRPLPTKQADTNVFPQVGWLLQLANGDRCVLADGATGTRAGVLLAYVCQGATWAGPLQWSSEPWRVEYFGKGAVRPTVQTVAVAWGG